MSDTRNSDYEANKLAKRIRRQAGEAIGVAEDGRHLILRREHGPPPRDEPRHHPRDVDPRRSLDVLVIGVGVRERAEVVAHPVLLEELHVLRAERHALPEEDVHLQALGEPIFLVDSNPTVELIARLIFNYTREQGFNVVKVMVWETPTSFASYTG